MHLLVKLGLLSTLITMAVVITVIVVLHFTQKHSQVAVQSRMFFNIVYVFEFTFLLDETTIRNGNDKRSF